MRRTKAERIEEYERAMAVKRAAAGPVRDSGGKPDAIRWQTADEARAQADEIGEGPHADAPRWLADMQDAGDARIAALGAA